MLRKREGTSSLLLFIGQRGNPVEDTVHMFNTQQDETNKPAELYLTWPRDFPLFDVVILPPPISATASKKDSQ